MRTRCDRVTEGCSRFLCNRLVGGLLLCLLCSAAWLQPARAAAVAAAPDGPRLLAYYVSWNSDYRAADIPYDRLTHISHAFLLPQADGSLAASGYLEPLLVDKAHAAGVKVLAAIGGYGGSAHFPALAGDPARRAALAANVADFLRTNGYDGVDIDWEFPQSAAERANLTRLIAALAAAFDAAPQPGPTWTISLAVPAGNWSGQWFDYAALDQWVDFYNLMAYDFHGSWSAHAGHNAALYRGGDPESGQSVAAALDYLLLVRAVPAQKVNVGIPFYGRKFAAADALYGRCGEPCPTVDYAYREIAPLVGSGWTEQWDSRSRVPYLTHDHGLGLISYDNPQSVKLKVAYARRVRGTGGVFVWELSGDAVQTGGQPLLDAMAAASDSVRGAAD